MFPARVKRLCTSAATACAAAILGSTILTFPVSAQVPGPRSGSAVIGTEAEDYATGVAVSLDGEVVVTGSIGYSEAALPLTPGTYQAPGTQYGGAYVAKLAPDGSLRLLSLIAPNARGEAIALDAAGNIVVAGITNSAFQVTPGAVNVGAGQYSRAFVMKLSADGSQVLYAALLGTVVPGQDLVGGGAMVNIAGPSLRLALDTAGNAYVAGTAAAGFPTTSGAVDRAFGGNTEAFVTKLSPDGSGLLFSTYLGGAGLDEAHGLAVDASGNAIVSGTTQSADFPTTTVLHDGTYSSAFVARLSPDGAALDFSTRISGSSGAFGRGVALGPTGDIYLAGITQSQDFPSTAAPFDTPWYVPRAEGFVMRLTTDASAIVYSTSLLTGAPNHNLEQGSHMPISLTVDSTGRAHVVGTSGAGYNVYAQVPLAFEAVVAADGSSFSARIIGSTGRGQGQSAFYDVAGNTLGDIARAMSTNIANDVYTVEPTYGKDPFFNYWSGEWEGPGDMSADGVVSWTIAERPPAFPDGDRDGVFDSTDNCVATFNPDQADLDGDGAGNACDTDRDNDTVLDAADNCVNVVNPDQMDQDGDHLGDACDARPLPPPNSSQLSLVATVPGVSAIVDGATVLAVNERTNVVYALTAQNNLRSIDGATGTVTRQVTLPIWSDSLAVNPNTNRLFITDTTTSSVRVFDGTTFAELSGLPAPGGVNGDVPRAVAVNKVTNRVYVARGATVDVYDGDTQLLLTRVQTFVYASKLFIDEDANKVYYRGEQDATWVLDGMTLQNTVVAGLHYLWTMDPMGTQNRLYFAPEIATQVGILNLATGVQSAAQAELQWVAAVRANPAASRVYAFGDPGTLPFDLYMLDVDGAVLGRFDVPGLTPRALAVNRATGYLYAVDRTGAIFIIRDAGAVPANTPAGGLVTVAAADNGASVTFGAVAAPGSTTVTPVDAASLNLSLPGGFTLSGAAQAYEIHTTATVSGIQVCLSGASMTAADFGNASILHGVNGAWQVESTTRDAATRSLCATVASLSPFAVGVRLDTTPPSISCGAAPAAWTTGPVSITCTAQDVSGLATSANASFTLTATVADGVENANALTNSRNVCDTAGNCATAGPFSVKLDRRRPVIQITAPVNRRYLMNESAAAAYACTDGGSGVATCAGTSANGAPVNTATIGSRTFAVTATDAAGNTAAAASVPYTVGFGIKVLFASDIVKGNKPAALAIRLVDGRNANVSSAAIQVTATGLKQLATGAMIAPSRWMYSGPAFVFGLGSYGYALETKNLPNGAYELQFTAGADPLVQKVQFTVR